MDIVNSAASGLLGGALIGLAAVVLLLANGRIAGISGIVAGLQSPITADKDWRIAFVVGLWLGALVYWLLRGAMFTVELTAAWPLLAVAGLLVGFGTRMGSGCTSGHGVCGIARMSQRSIVATLTFMATGAVTVYVVRHVLG
jgi:uncharacterized membrane protein YedE/YeeE